MEERILAQARADGAPRLTRAAAAQLVGADLERLEPALTGLAYDADATQDAQDAPTPTGRREDQMAAIVSVLRDDKRVSVINALAGSGKTRVVAEAARAWQSAGLGPVIGITPSQFATADARTRLPGSAAASRFGAMVRDRG